jgi:chorismate mutase
VPSQLKDWRDGLENLDAELIRLLNRRVELATQLLKLLRREDLTLGLLEHDADRLLILLYPNTENGPLPLKERDVLKLFSLISRECRRIAVRQIVLLERNGRLNSEGDTD